MGFTASKVFWWFAAPANLALAVLLLALLLLALGRRRGAGLLMVLLAGFGLALTLLPVRDWVLRPLEDRFALPTALARVDGVIVLGGAIDSALSANRGQPVINDSAERLTVFLELARRYPSAKLVFSGGSAAVFDDSAREADIARDLFQRLGLDPARVIYERDSRNTHENAVLSRRLAEPQPGEVWLLVTSAYHMPRAVGTFRQANWNIVPYPVDFSVSRSESTAPGGLLEGLNGFHWGLREWIGLAYYRVVGFTDSWFPGP
jgi:uncharacterized SAM-binding protein YcdF (DUF218 family)